MSGGRSREFNTKFDKWAEGAGGNKKKGREWREGLEGRVLGVGDDGGKVGGGGNGREGMRNDVDWELLPELLDGGQGKDNRSNITGQSGTTEGFLRCEGGGKGGRKHKAVLVRRWGGGRHRRRGSGKHLKECPCNMQSGMGWSHQDYRHRVAP